ncbi:hypothetical protein NC651_010653 [Populus alba x Populus x berolinensis]|nr:hypothetical protein NC651_010653 [Populus alba x Populus x berolinensis]
MPNHCLSQENGHHYKPFPHLYLVIVHARFLLADTTPYHWKGLRLYARSYMTSSLDPVATMEILEETVKSGPRFSRL